MNPEKAHNQNQTQNQNEGEGSRTAARRYNQGVRETVESGRVEELAEEAREATEGEEGEELRRAEEKGKSHRS
jgi:hypothetical protein